MSKILKFERFSEASSETMTSRAIISGSISMGSFSSSVGLHADPAVAVALGVRYGAMNGVAYTGVPAEVRDALRQHAGKGSAAAQTTTEWLDRQLLSAISAMEEGQ